MPDDSRSRLIENLLEALSLSVCLETEDPPNPITPALLARSPGGLRQRKPSNTRLYKVSIGVSLEDLNRGCSYQHPENMHRNSRELTDHHIRAMG